MGKNTTAAKPAAKKEENQPIPETIKHIVSQEDLDNNPELVEKGIQVGEEIDIVNPEYVAPAEKPAANKEEKDGIPNLENLKALLGNLPHIHVVFVNEAGEWFFQAKPGFKAYEREDILNG